MGYDKFSKKAVSKTAGEGMSELDKSNYMQLCSDVINMAEGNYNDEDMKSAYEFAKKEWDRLENETITNET